MKTIVHFCAGLEEWNGMANTARQFVAEGLNAGHESKLTNRLDEIVDNIDEVYIHGAWLPVLWKVAKKTKAIGAKLIIRPAGSYDSVRLAHHGWKKRLVSFWERRMLRRADVLLATCKAEKGWIEAYLGKKCPPVEVMDIKRFFDLPNSEAGDLPTDRPLHLLYLGRRHPLKGVEYLEDAVRQMQNASASPRLCMRIVSSAFGEEKNKVWNWCDILVLPTLSENFGRVVAEALERGKRVITTDGAPAWGDGNDYGGRLVYLTGYRDGMPEERVRLLKSAIEGHCK